MMSATSTILHSQRRKRTVESRGTQNRFAKRRQAFAEMIGRMVLVGQDSQESLLVARAGQVAISKVTAMAPATQWHARP